MSEVRLMHATLVSVEGKGVLFIGKSRSGKSDMALRLIEEKNAFLVADDVVELWVYDGGVVGKAPQRLRGMLEISGIGGVRYEALPEETVDLVVRLKNEPTEIERMPNPAYENILGLEIPAIDLYAKEASAVHKVIAVLRGGFVFGAARV